MAAIPASIVIGPYTYAVAVTDEGLDRADSECGRISFARETITVSPDQAPRQVKDTLLHEVLHGIVRLSGIHLDEEERLVLGLAALLFMVMEQNPALVAYLMDGAA